MPKAFTHNRTAGYNNGENGLINTTLIDNMNNEIVITEAMIQLACDSLDHDSELTLSVNPDRFK